MAKTYTYYIGQESQDSHQTSPGYLLTVLRFKNRDTFNYKNKGGPTDVRQPLLIINDCISLTVRQSKQELQSQMTAVLLGGDLNYSTAIHPGDFILVNMLNWEKDVNTVYEKAGNKKPINKFEDGFKGIFKIQSVRKRLSTDPNTGTKRLYYQIHALGFTEFKTKMYYNQAMADSFKKDGTEIFQFLVGKYFRGILKKEQSVQNLLRALFTILIGQDRTSSDTKIRKFGNTHFKLPPDVGKFLGRKMTYASDMFNICLGIWSKKATGNDDPKQGFNSIFTKNENTRFFLTGTKLAGNKLAMPVNWNNVEVWSILQGYLNNTLNEMYSVYRLDKNGHVMPTIIARQKPFNSEHFKPVGDVKTSKFMNLPRWKISSTLIKDLDLGFDEAARINFVQVFTRAIAATAQDNFAAQTALKNFVTDSEDVIRHGLRPYVVTSNFDYPVGTQKALHAKAWANLVSDWLFNGHLRENGTFICAGIVEPIAVGDNLEYNGVIYHIEEVVHNMTMNPNGIKDFTTTIKVSFGTHSESTKSTPIYSQMEYTDAYTERQYDYERERVMPGFSDTQDIPSREFGEETENTKEATFSPKKLKKKIDPNDKSIKSQDGTEEEYKSKRPK